MQLGNGVCEPPRDQRRSLACGGYALNAVYRLSSASCLLCLECLVMKVMLCGAGGTQFARPARAATTRVECEQSGG
eukprot:1148326-Pleurochrysis_carterae.AAC.1